MKKVDERRIDVLISQLTLEEKIDMIHGAGLFQTGGVSRLGIPPLKMSDGPMGVRKEFARDSWHNVGTTDDYVSYLPSNSALASTWSRDMAYQTGRVLGAEARGRGKDVILAPGINIKRSPLCGRNFEYMSEDPRLVEEMVVPLIKGIQENDLAACVKHLAVNNQETDRLEVDTYLDERTLREIYLPGFKAAIDKGESHTIMGAYNRLFGEYCSQSRHLLTKILRDEWAYDGAVVSDWGAVHDTKEAAESDLDIEMSVTGDFDNYYMANPLLEAVRNGLIKEEFIDKKVGNILRTMLRLNMLGEDRRNRKSGTYNAPSHREAILACAEESIILLKNEDNRLPIQKDSFDTLAIIGQNGERLHAGGGGSAEIKALYEISPLLGMRMELGGDIEVKYAKGYYIPSKKERKLNWQQDSLENKELAKEEERLYEEKLKDDIKKSQEDLLSEAVQLAKETKEVILVVGLDHEHDIEGRDRIDMKLPYGQDRLISEVLAVNPDAIVVVVAGSPVEMGSWVDNARAIVWSYYAGMEGGRALAKVLLGDINPSGKLAETFPKNHMDSPAHKLGEFGTYGKVTYNEGVYVGYRYYDSYDINVEFSFGHGLSYTTFEYSDLVITLDETSLEDDLNALIHITIRNTGTVSGAEVVQVYVADKEATVARPAHELKGFTKVYLEPGKEQVVVIKLHKGSFGFYDENKHSFVVEPGDFIIQVSSSSRDIRLSETIRLNKEYKY
jgi:beta-glucosidase